MTVFIKDPDAALAYGVDWSDWLLDGESITNSTWFVDPVDSPPLEVLGDDGSPPDTAVLISGGELGVVYRVTNRIVTSFGNTADRSLVIRIEQQ
jgi:hypothetical protein